MYHEFSGPGERGGGQIPPLQPLAEKVVDRIAGFGYGHSRVAADPERRLQQRLHEPLYSHPFPCPHRRGHGDIQDLAGLGKAGADILQKPMPEELRLVNIPFTHA